ncbi:hypothetical protein; putative signal peptide [Frankia alni ACN14a]|uniref:Uncharacterized protein n=1 Tax=Frankia alni (strain DSM 45986 / CECT 9034 / ACN14a) TaxID=326424 RepID=Q0RUD1_FRAAA|nr:hypothetical protein; putative signal peptide [Frankia alni ACN14a]
MSPGPSRRRVSLQRAARASLVAGAPPAHVAAGEELAQPGHRTAPTPAPTVHDTVRLLRSAALSVVARPRESGRVSTAA